MLIELLVVTRIGEEEGISVRGLSPMRGWGEGGIVLRCKFGRNLGNHFRIITGPNFSLKAFQSS